MFVHSLIVLVGVVSAPTAAPIPVRLELAPAPREKVARPWERTDLRPPVGDVPREPRNIGIVFLFSTLKSEPKTTLAFHPGATLADVELIRASGFTEAGIESLLVADGGKEWVAITGEDKLKIDGKEVAGHIAITIAKESGQYRIKAVHITTATNLKPLRDAFFEAHPNLRRER